MPRQNPKRDQDTPEEMIFEANLDEFATRVSLICGLEAGGKLKPAEAYAQIRDLWKQLKRSKKNLKPGKGDKPDGQS